MSTWVGAVRLTSRLVAVRRVVATLTIGSGTKAVGTANLAVVRDTKGEDGKAKGGATVLRQVVGKGRERAGDSSAVQLLQQHQLVFL